MRLLTKLTIACLTLTGCGGSGSSPAVISPPHPANVFTPIQELQGSGDRSPLVGQPVIVAGIVTGDFQDGDADTQRNLGGFFIQEEIPDADPMTSDGVFVYDGPTPTVNVNPGDRVSVTGTVNERFGETQITAAAVSLTGTGVAEPTDITFPVATTNNSDGLPIADLEIYEGMLVTMPQSLFVNDLFNLERFGEIQLSEGGRLYQFTNANSPNVADNADYQQQIAARTLILDDGSSQQNPANIFLLTPTANNATDYFVRSGDSLTGLTGNIRYSRGSGGSGFEAYRLEPVMNPVFDSRNARLATPPDPGGEIKVASFNVLNFFTTIDSGQSICSPSANMGCRGADSVEEFDRQRAKLINTLLLLDADIVGLMELENNGAAALGNLVDGLNAISGASTWAYIDTGIIGADAIAVGFIYKTSRVRPVGSFAVLTSDFDRRFVDNRSRPTLAQTFESLATSGRFTVAVNHLKSRGSPCDDIGDPDRNDGQGNCNVTRRNAVLAVIDWLATDPTASMDTDFLIIGDMNAYLAEDPVVAFENAGFIALLGSAVGSAAYSFVFAGQAGALDHAFASPSLAGQVSGIAEWHINADEPRALDYNLEFGRDPGLFDATSPYRASDHDPVIIGVNP